MGAVHFLWLGGCGAASPPIEEVGPTHVFEAASDGGHGVGARFRPAASRLFEPVPAMQLQALSAMPDPVGRPRVRQGSQRIRSPPASQVRMQAATASDRSRRGFRAAMASSTRPASGCFLIRSIHAFRLPLSGAMHRPVFGLRQGRRRERNIMVEIRKFSAFRRRAGPVVGSGLLFGPPSFLRRRGGWRIRSDVLGNEVGVFGFSIFAAGGGPIRPLSPGCAAPPSADL